MISTLFQCFLISTFPIYTYFNVILTPGFTDVGGPAGRPGGVGGVEEGVEAPVRIAEWSSVNPGVKITLKYV